MDSIPKDIHEDKTDIQEKHLGLHEDIVSVKDGESINLTTRRIDKKRFNKRKFLIPVLLILCVAASVGAFFVYKHYQSNSSSTSSSTGIHKIKHIVIIMQENRSFDSYFGTYPGADGIPMTNGVPTVCVPNPATSQCDKPYLDNSDKNAGGPHGQTNATADINGGKMDGFIGQAEQAFKNCAPDDPSCAGSTGIDVMGYHNASSIANYWTYAKDFVLNDHLFQSNASWSLPEHLFLVSEWSAKCSQAGNPQSCVNNLQSPGFPPDQKVAASNLIVNCRKGTNTSTCQNALGTYGITHDMEVQLQSLIQKNCNLASSYILATDSYSNVALSNCESAINGASISTNLKQKLTTAANILAPPDYAWTDLTYLLHKQNVSWGYYVMNGSQPDCADDTAVTCAPVAQNSKTPGIWNPLPYFDTVKQDNQLGNIQSLNNFYSAVKKGTSPAVSWITPAGLVSEHPPALVSTGQSYVTGLINEIMKGPDWNSTAIILNWDDWGGFYDHVVPPTVDQNGYGLRLPSIIISPYAKRGYIDNQTLSQDAYVKFIEDDFLNSQRLDPKTDGRPDPRPDVRENNPQLGNLVSDFNFNQSPRSPVLLPGGTIY